MTGISLSTWAAIAEIISAGSIVSTMYRKLRQVNEDLREEQQQPSWAEWFDWLGDLATRTKNNEAPAHIRFR